VNFVSENSFFHLKDKKYISLKTFYKSGKGVVTPVEFAEKEGKFYVSTRKKSWKVMRILGNPNAKIAPCTIRGKILGKEMDVTVRILSNAEEVKAAKEALDGNFNKGFNKIIRFSFIFINKLQFWKKPEERVFLEISP